MTTKLATLKNKRHTGQREGPRWKTLAFLIVVVSILVTVTILVYYIGLEVWDEYLDVWDSIILDLLEGVGVPHFCGTGYHTLK